MSWNAMITTHFELTPINCDLHNVMDCNQHNWLKAIAADCDVCCYEIAILVIY